MKRPKDYTTVASNPGTVRATFSTCEIEGHRTIHLDCFVKDSSPYGHPSVKEAKRLLKFLGEAIPWMEEEFTIPDKEWQEIQDSLTSMLEKFK